jgi:hypothetical protein
MTVPALPLNHNATPRTAGRGALVRLVLGNAQMLGAVISLLLLLLLLLLIQAGLNEWSLGSAVGTCLLTTVSVLLFGRGAC